MPHLPLTFREYWALWTALGLLLLCLFQLALNLPLAIETWLSDLWAWVTRHESLTAGILGLIGGTIAYLGIRDQTKETQRQITIKNFRKEFSIIVKIEQQTEKLIVDVISDYYYTQDIIRDILEDKANIILKINERSDSMINYIKINPKENIYIDDEMQENIGNVNYFISIIKNMTSDAHENNDVESVLSILEKNSDYHIELKEALYNLSMNCTEKREHIRDYVYQNSRVT